jgi:anaerobic magnesium-protoporphyrin IX monomethyl ester cyclase
MADVILVFPRTGMDKKAWGCCLPLSLLHVASTIAGEFDVKIIDQRVDADWKKTLTSLISDRTICVGISSMTGRQICNGLEISKFVKNIRKAIPIVWGGIHPTLMPQQTIENPYIDYVVMGEGEFSFQSLVRRLSNGGSPKGIPGIIWKDRDGIGSTPFENNFCLDDLPEMPYSLLDMKNYISPKISTYDFARRALPFLSSRGCPYSCIYCAQAAMYKSRYRKMLPENVYSRVSKLVNDFQLDCVDFYDDEFAVDPAWITKISELIHGQFMWTCQARMDDLARLDLKRLYRNGLRVAKVGLESGSNKILNYLKKRETVEIYIETNKKLADAHIVSQYNFMIGYPNENIEDIYATVDLALKLLEDNPYAVINSFAILTIYPGTEISMIAQKEYGMDLPDKLEDWASINRQNITTPWAVKERNTYLYLQYSSHFLCSAKRYASNYKFIPGFVFDMYSKYLKNIYVKKKFNSPPDYYLLKFMFKYILKA